jgi:signal transduction histidine kinase
MKPNDDIAFLAVMGIAAMLLLFAGFLVVFVFMQRKKMGYQKSIQALRETQQNQLIEAAVRSEEEERHRIAEALHDEVGAILSSAKLHFQDIGADDLNDRARMRYKKGEELLGEAVIKIRDISHNLHSSILKEFGLNEAISHFMNKLTRDGMIHSTVTFDDKVPPRITDSDMSIYRLVQELVNNIIKHARAANIHIRTFSTGDGFNLTIFHDGNGLTQQQYENLRFKKEGLGLKTIQNRIISLKGSLTFSHEPNGYYIHLNIPSI